MTINESTGKLILDKIRDRRTRLSNRARGKKESRSHEIAFAIRELSRLEQWILDNFDFETGEQQASD